MSLVTKDSCCRIHPVLLPFLEQCLLSQDLNSQGGVLEIKRPKSRFRSQTIPPILVSLQCMCLQWSTGL